MAHTEGPWNIVKPGGPAGPFWGLVNQWGNVVAMQIVTEADANLCSVAPDLLRVCEGIKQYMDSDEVVLDGRGRMPNRLYDALDEVIGWANSECE